MESLDEITDKLQTGVLFDGENEKLIKKILFEEQVRMYNKSKKKQKCICPNCYNESIATVYKGNIIKNLIMDCQSYTKYRPNETTGGIFVSWRRKEELPTGA